MPDFEALGRDVAAAVDSEGEPAVATAVKTLWVWAGFDAGTNPNHLWELEYSKDEDGFSVSARVKDKDVWAPEPVVSPPASAAELAASAAPDESLVDDQVSAVAHEPVDGNVTITGNEIHDVPEHGIAINTATVVPGDAEEDTPAGPDDASAS